MMDLLVSKGISVYAIDLRGMGSTERDPSGWTCPLQSVQDISDVFDFLADRGVFRPVFVGWSHGALIAQLFAQQYPNKMSSLVLYGSVFNPDDLESMTSESVSAIPAVFATSPFALDSPPRPTGRQASAPRHHEHHGRVRDPMANARFIRDPSRERLSYTECCCKGSIGARPTPSLRRPGAPAV